MDKERTYKELIRIPLHHVEDFSIHCIQFKLAFEYGYKTIFKDKNIPYEYAKYNDRLFVFDDDFIIATTKISYLILKDVTNYEN